MVLVLALSFSLVSLLCILTFDAIMFDVWDSVYKKSFIIDEVVEKRYRYNGTIVQSYFKFMQGSSITFQLYTF